MRTLSASALSKIAQQYGAEPVVIIEVQWVKGGPRLPYADKQAAGIPGKILEVSDLDNVVNVSDSGDSQQISVTLDDVDSSIKNIMDAHDIHMRDVWVYQWFEGLDLTDKFLLFKGKINSPITWNEGDRSVSFDIVTQIESVEVGFSPEQGQFDYIPNDLIGQAWPMVFGTSVHSRALKITNYPKGALCDGLAIRDLGLESRVEAMAINIDDLQLQKSRFKHESDAEKLVGNQAAFEVKDSFAKSLGVYEIGFLADYEKSYGALLSQTRTELNEIRIFGGEKFPQGQRMVLDVGGAVVQGHFAGNLFKIDRGDCDLIIQQVGLTQGQWNCEDKVESFYEDTIYTKLTWTGTDPKIISYLRGRAALHPKVVEEPETYLPFAEGVREFDPRYPTATGNMYTRFYRGPDPKEPTQASRFPFVRGWTKPWYPNCVISGDDLGYFFAKPGTNVSRYDPVPQRYIVSITPGQVLRVMAFATYAGQKFLIDVPKDLYTVSVEHFGSVSATVVTLKDDLSKDETTNWSDDLYITFKSDIGPNVVDIMRYLIETFSDFEINDASFNAVRAKVQNYPAHFTLYDKKDLFQVLSEISWQSCCSIRQVDGEFYLTYLPDQPTPVATVTDDDIEIKTLSIGHTSTEELVTKMVCEWYATGAQSEPNKIILRHNIGKYGTHERSFNFYIYNVYDLVERAATFWLIRYANTWKKVSFTVPLNFLNVESLDAVTLNLSKPFISSGAVGAVVEQAVYNSADQNISMVCWTPIKAGTMVPYIFAWPAQVDATAVFPTTEDLLYEGMGFGYDAEGDIGDDAADEINRVDFVGIDGLYLWPSMQPKRRNGKGKKNPSDKADGTPGDVKVAPAAAVGNSLPGQDTPTTASGTGGSPVRQDGSGGFGAGTTGSTSSGLSEIDIRKTKIKDGTASALLSTVFQGIADGKLMLSTNVVVSDGTNSASFAFSYDTESSKYGAGIAFLKE